MSNQQASSCVSRSYLWFDDNKFCADFRSYRGPRVKSLCGSKLQKFENPQKAKEQKPRAKQPAMGRLVKKSDKEAVSGGGKQGTLLGFLGGGRGRRRSRSSTLRTTIPNRRHSNNISKNRWRRGNVCQQATRL